MTKTGFIQVPEYFSDNFDRRPSREAQASEQIRLMVKRVHRLIANALNEFPNADWIILDTEYRSTTINEPYGIETDGVMIYIFGEERGKKSPIAIFKDITMASDYFVWLVSKGQRQIDWELS